MSNNELNSQDKFYSHQLVLNVIRKNFPITRQEIASKTSLSIPTVSRITNKLFDDGFIEEETAEQNGVGRKTSLIILKKNLILTSGVEYDGEVIKISIIDEQGKVIDYSSIHLEKPIKDPIELCSLIYLNIKKLFESNYLEISKLFAIGIAVPGLINNNSGEILLSTQLGIKNINLKKFMEEISGTKCIIENDLKAHGYAEYLLGNARNSKIAVLVSIGTGIGTVAIVNGEILRGVTNSAGELGHISNNLNGTMCSCGKIGCLQTNVAKSFLLNEANNVCYTESTDEIFDKAINGEKWAERIVNKMISFSSIAIETAVCAYNPDTVILCGSIINERPEIFPRIKELLFKDYIWEDLKDSFKISNSYLGEQGAVIGVGIVAQDDFYKVI